MSMNLATSPVSCMWTVRREMSIKSLSIWTVTKIIDMAKSWGLAMSMKLLHLDYHLGAIALQGAYGEGFADERRRGLGHGVLDGKAGVLLRA